MHFRPCKVLLIEDTILVLNALQLLDRLAAWPDDLRHVCAKPWLVCDESSRIKN